MTRYIVVYEAELETDKANRPDWEWLEDTFDATINEFGGDEDILIDSTLNVTRGVPTSQGSLVSVGKALYVLYGHEWHNIDAIIQGKTETVSIGYISGCLREGTAKVVRDNG